MLYGQFLCKQSTIEQIDYLFVIYTVVKFINSYEKSWPECQEHIDESTLAEKLIQFKKPSAGKKLPKKKADHLEYIVP